MGIIDQGKAKKMIAQDEEMFLDQGRTTAVVVDNISFRPDSPAPHTGFWGLNHHHVGAWSPQRPVLDSVVIHLGRGKPWEGFFNGWAF